MQETPPKKQRVVEGEGTGDPASTDDEAGADGNAVPDAGAAWEEKMKDCVEADEINYCINQDRFL